MEIIKKYYKIVLLLLITSVLSVYIGYSLNQIPDKEEDNLISYKEEIIEETNDEVFVDIKGEVKKPGVYKVNSKSIINDVIKNAGGLTKNAYTKNINLSKSVVNEMVIYIFSKSEIKALKNINTPVKDISNEICTTQVIEVNNCPEITNPTISSDSKEDNETNSLVNINSASKEELMTITGIGSSKADAIITYRKEHKFEKIEDIQNVSGIGASVFEKIKQYITV